MMLGYRQQQQNIPASHIRLSDPPNQTAAEEVPALYHTIGSPFAVPTIGFKADIEEEISKLLKMSHWDSQQFVDPSTSSATNTTATCVIPCSLSENSALTPTQPHDNVRGELAEIELNNLERRLKLASLNARLSFAEQNCAYYSVSLHCLLV
jgi:3-polyprenyl-4-hydroxybenzoate decarboxylase